jgi:hypothetical protein
VNFEERHIEVDGLPTRYLAAGTDGPAAGPAARRRRQRLDWQWVMPTWRHPTRLRPGPDPAPAAASSPTSTTRRPSLPNSSRVFLDALEVERAAVVGNSLGGLGRSALGVVRAIAGKRLGPGSKRRLGREVTYALRSLALPGYRQASGRLGQESLPGRLRGPWGGQHSSSRVPRVFP